MKLKSEKYAKYMNAVTPTAIKEKTERVLAERRKKVEVLREKSMEKDALQNVPMINHKSRQLSKNHSF